MGVAEAKLDAANVQVGLRTMKAPFDGLVYEVQKRQFEFVRTGEPVFRLADLTQLRVQGQAEVSVPPNQLLNSNNTAWSSSSSPACRTPKMMPCPALLSSSSEN